MKKLFIVIAVLLLAGAGYFTYEKWVKHNDLTAWSFISSDAAFVFEVDLVQDYTTISQFPAWSALSNSTGFQKIEDGLQFLDSINGKGGFQAIFKDAPVLISSHKVSNDDLDFLFILNIQNISQNTFVGAAVGRLQKSGYRFKTRNYNGFNISEISKDGEVFTCIFYKNYFLASFTPYLVEDAIRTISDGGLSAYENTFLSLDGPLPSGLINTYVNYEKTSSLLSGITNKKLALPLTHGAYTMSLDSSHINVSGFSYAEEGWLATHRQAPAAFDMAEVIPENSAYLYHIGSSELSNWKEKQINFLRSSEPEIKKLQDSLRKAFDFNADQVLDLVDEEIGIIGLESTSPRDEKNLTILEVKDTQDAINFFQQLTERVAISRGDSVYTESYSENEIKFLPIKDFPQTFLGAMAGAYEQCFYLSHRNYIIFSNDLPELKNLVTSIQNEDTWGKSLRMNEFLERGNQAANVSLILNIPRAWNNLEKSLNAEWAEYFNLNKRHFRSFELAAFQFSYLDNRYFTNFTFSQPTIRSTSTPKTNPETGIQFASPLTTKPYLLRSHAHKNFDIIVQDSTHVIYYLDQNQNAQWSMSLEGPIVSDIYPIDYYQNGKLQYAFATRSAINIVDRTGESIPGFPKPIPTDATIDHFNVIDYDLSRNYRMAITDSEGNIFLADKELEILEGWSPKAFNRTSIQPLNHARLGRRDVMISIQGNGIINVLNRRGEQMSGFPFDTKQALGSNYFLRSSNALSNSSLSIITQGGELTEINLEGDVIKREQLLKSTSDAKFELIPDRGGKSFLIIRKEENRYDVLDDTGNLLFSKDYLSDESILIQYYQFGAGKDLVVFTDTSNETLYIYDKSGNLVTGNPLNSAFEISILYSSAKKEFQVFSSWASNLELYRFTY